MSEETYKQIELMEEGPSMNLGIPEKQPHDLGVHKIVFHAFNLPIEPSLNEHLKDNLKESLKEKPEFITIVQDEYCHWDKGSGQNNNSIRNRVITASVLCILFIALEVLGGYLSNSLVIAADATQLLTVFSTLMVSLLALELSSRRPSQATPVQWYRAEVLAALLSVLLTWVITSAVVHLAIERLIRGEFNIDVDMMLATSAFGVVANLIMGMTLHSNCHLRYPIDCRSQSDSMVNINVRAAFIHIVCDFLFSLGVFIIALAIDCCPDWHIVDPIGTIVLSFIVLLITLAVLKDILYNIVESVPKGISFNDVLKIFLTIEGVQQVQNMKFWALSMDKMALSAHLTIRPGVDHNEVLKTASRRIHANYNLFEMTLHIEAYQEIDIVPRLEKEPL